LIHKFAATGRFHHRAILRLISASIDIKILNFARDRNVTTGWIHNILNPDSFSLASIVSILAGFDPGLLIIPLAYCIGCCNAGYYITKFKTNTDIRKHATHSTGARNVKRLLGTKAAIFTFLLDAAKGALVVIVALIIKLPPTPTLIAIMAVIVGHIWPAQLKFKGGKGLAVTLGSLIIYDYRIAALALIVFAIAYLLIRKYALSAFVAILSLPLAAAITNQKTQQLALFVAIVIIILAAHRNNLTELIRNFTSKNNRTQYNKKLPNA